MSKNDQGETKSRYQMIPRTLVFLTRGNSVLLIKGAANKRLWANRYNGLGGHIERGEDALSAAKREIREEAGISLDYLNLIGTILVDASPDVGICIFVFKGDYTSGILVDSTEGTLEWVKEDAWGSLPLVEDLPFLLPRVLSWKPGLDLFFANSYYDEKDNLRVDFRS
jgi:8-oxo-dGTP diphosphatase